MTALLRPDARLPAALSDPAAMPMSEGGEASRPVQAPPGARPPAPGASPSDPEDDESGRGTPRFGPTLLVGALAWVALLLLLL